MTYVPYDSRLPQPSRGRGGRPQGETPQASYAFHLYAALPAGERTYRKVLDLLVMEGKLKPGSLRLIETWGRKWNWIERVKVYDAAKIEERREQWERERVQMHEYVSKTAREAYEEVAKLLVDRAKNGRLGNDAAVQLLKIAADLEHRSRENLAGKDKQKEQQFNGVQIIIETDPEPRTPPRPGIVVNQAPELLSAGGDAAVEGVARAEEEDDGDERGGREEGDDAPSPF